MADKLSKSAPVAIAELVDALEFVSAGESLDAEAYIGVATGKVHFVSGDIDLEDGGVPDDVEESEDYVAVLHRRFLDLGSRLVFVFAGEVMPDDYDTVRDIFRRRGAYRRFKDLLDRRRMLDAWSDFEARATERALRAWCAENDIALADERDVSGSG
jgi:hypothetical protein